MSADLPCGARIVAAQRYRLKTLTLRDELFIAVLHGRKELHSADSRFSALPGQGLLMASGTQWDVVNDPHGQPRYEALVLSFTPELLADFQTRHASPDLHPVETAQRISVDAELLSTLQRAQPGAASGALSTPLLLHRCMEVLLLLAERGWRYRSPRPQGWDERVRRMVAQRPHADWSSASVAALFHISESTLRRRLDEHGQTLAALVREVRLETALGLLQTTALAVGEVAQRCGWESHSRFTAAFQERWGVTPSVVRARLKDSGQNLTLAG